MKAVSRNRVDLVRSDRGNNYELSLPPPAMIYRFMMCMPRLSSGFQSSCSRTLSSTSSTAQININDGLVITELERPINGNLDAENKAWCRGVTNSIRMDAFASINFISHNIVYRTNPNVDAARTCHACKGHVFDSFFMIPNPRKL